MLRMPGWVDVHVHLREPGATHKEDWSTGTAAALAGGVTAVLAMPNTRPTLADRESLKLSLDLAAQKARCDYGAYVAATDDNADTAPALAPHSAGLKFYLDHTFGDLKMADTTRWLAHLERWPADWPLVAHAEERTTAAVIGLARLAGRGVHIAHVARREEIVLIRAAKERGWAVTCEVAPHHLFLTREDEPRIGPGRCEVRPSLVEPSDRAALWENLAYIDCFATDHAPHLLAEKDGPKPPPGFPGLETALPLLMTAVHEGRLSLRDLEARACHNPRRIFRLPEQPDTWVEIDEEARWTLPASGYQTRCDWSPFAGTPVRGRVERVVLRGAVAYEGGQVLAAPGSGLGVRRPL
jgi:carbamoyl-phosphate synthase/aspartate carbamoyltransferase/dihydroorotase